MIALPKQKMTVDEYLVWSEQTPGRYELSDGYVVKMQSERAGHARGKQSLLNALQDAIKAAGISDTCEAFPDGMTVRIDDDTAYEPDALVNCGPRLDDDALEATHPIVVVEVLSPSTGGTDRGAKLAGYFKHPSVVHYLIVNPKKLPVIHHARQSDGKILTSLVGSGLLSLSPPGITLSVDDLLTI